MPRPQVGTLCSDDCCLSDCPSVCPVPKSRPEGRSKLRIGRIKPMTWVTRDPTQRSKVRVTRPVNTVAENNWHILGTERPTNFKLGTRMELIWPASPTCAVTSKVKGYNVTLSVWRVFAHNSTRKVVETSKWAEGCPCYAWHCTPVPSTAGSLNQQICPHTVYKIKLIHLFWKHSEVDAPVFWWRRRWRSLMT